MPKCGSQICICDLPVRYDSYIGCAHACAYCFVKRKNDIAIVERGETAKNLAKFIAGERSSECKWVDWDIPIHYGGMSDPFQPVEREKHYTLEALKVFAETKYPVVISTKGRLCIEEPWLSLLRECNVVVQISMACSSYDKLETGAPTYEERLHMVEVLSKNVPRVIARCQPYMHECFEEILGNVKRLAEAGAHGIIFEGMKFVKKKPGLVRVGGDWTYPVDVVKRDYSLLKAECHKYGLAFYCGENRLREMGDSLTCCGIDGLEGFVGNHYNANHILNGDVTEATPAMEKVGSAQCFKALHQGADMTKKIQKSSFKDMMLYELKYTDSLYTALGKNKSKRGRNV